MDRLEIAVQNESSEEAIPPSDELITWSTAALEKSRAEITIRIVDEKESAHLNQTYRHKTGPTNVLSFPMSSFHAEDLLLGDIVICAPVVKKEAEQQNKSFQAHWAHLTIHGILHLQGYDHIDEADAKVMEAKEITILSRLGIANPYE